MPWADGIWLRWRSLFQREQVSQELDREVQFHLDQQIAENIANGMSPSGARSAALRTFGNPTVLKEEARDTWGWTWLEQLLQDARYALRQLRKTPGFAATAVLTLALGIGANAAIFTLVHAVLLKNLPVADPKMLIRIGDNSDCCVNSGAIGTGNYALFSTEVYERLRKYVPEFEQLAAMQAGFAFMPMVARRDGTPENARSVVGEFVSGNYFQTFGLRPAAGRLFSYADDVAGAPIVAVMSHAAWNRDYAKADSVIGATFWINTKAVTVVGIAPAGFFGDRLSTSPPDFYFPLESLTVIFGAPFVHDPETRWLYMIGRVKPATQLGMVQEKVSGFVRQWLKETKAFSAVPDKSLPEKTHVVLTSGGAGIQDLREQYQSNLQLLLGASALVLFIACANIANLLLARGMRRKVEISLRGALGAARSRIARQLLTESVVLAGLGGIAGLAVAYLGARVLLRLAFSAEAQNIPIDPSPSLPVVGFALTLTLITGILFGVAPAWMVSQTNPSDALKSGVRGTTTGASVLQRGLVVLQAALSLVLLVGAGLFAQSLTKLQRTDLKLDSRNRYVAHINPLGAGYAPHELEALYRTMEQRFHELPGISRVGICTYSPMEENNWSNSIQVQGLPDTGRDASFIKANAEYFDSVGTQVLMGRGIGPQDTFAAPSAAVVNQTFLKDFIPAGENPIGRRFGAPGPDSTSDYQIVGVVEDTTYTTVRWPDHRMYFVPINQKRSSDQRPIDQDLSRYAGALVLATQGPVNNMEELTRKTLAGINPNLAIVKFQTFDQQIADRFNHDRMIAQLTSLFAVLALLLATIGLYGVTAYTVARRTSEIGIRMALGARRRGVVAMVMRGAMSQTVVGLAIGIPAAFACARFVRSQLFEIKGINIAVVLLAVLTLALASLLAGMIPARAAAATEPAQTLRAE